MKRAKGLEPGSTRDLQGGYKFTVYKTKANMPVEFGKLGYADAAIRSYEEFKRAQVAGKIPPSSRFQVSLRTPIAVVLSFCEPDSIPAVWQAYEARLNEEVDEIAKAIPADKLALQWDIAVEICFILENPEIAKVIPMEPLVASIAHCADKRACSGPS